ncbi:hypothetical protein A2V82_13370 [candidate division KSB1 bacterium RBG_16_48_16]|nr:MAG: hypothetical protein A2V82_13370 [candidate division KSB1 bacterium RBG_16_48_16]
MIHVLVIHHRVEDYARFKAHFDAQKVEGKKGGIISYQMFHKAEDPNDLVFLFDWDNIENFKKYAGSPEFQREQKDAGLIDQPEIYILNEIEKGSL